MSKVTLTAGKVSEISAFRTTSLVFSIDFSFNATKIIFFFGVVEVNAVLCTNSRFKYVKYIGTLSNIILQ